MNRRSGGISVIRIGTIAAVIGVLFIIGGAVSFFADQASRQVPLDIAAYPGAQPSGQRIDGQAARRLFFRIPNTTPEQVVAYYEQRLDEHYGSTEFNCIRTPSTGEFDTSRPGTAPYQFVCNFDRSGFRAIQYTRVTIQPGVFNSDPSLNTEGMTIVEHEQVWQPA